MVLRNVCLPGPRAIREVIPTGSGSGYSQSGIQCHSQAIRGGDGLLRKHLRKSGANKLKQQIQKLFESEGEVIFDRINAKLGSKLTKTT